MEINHVISLGSICITASFLKRNKLKLASYPFDWIYSNCNMIMHCLQDDFKTFLDKAYYNSITDTTCQHAYYHKKESGLTMFNHHNPMLNEEHYKYFQRCVNRFKTVLKCNEYKLFITTWLGFMNVDQNLYHNFISFNEDFSKHAQNYTLLVIINVSNKEVNFHRFVYYKNIHFLEVHTTSSIDGLFFKNESDNIYIDNILMNNYNFKLI